MQHDWLTSLIGGLMIGAAGAALLIANGRIFGVSGLVGCLLTPRPRETAWRIAAVLGLLVGGGVLLLVRPGAFDTAPVRPLLLTAAAGLLVGFGTRLGGGCTSGHGICGVSRWSKRSLAATAVFLAVGMIVASLAGRVGGGP